MVALEGAGNLIATETWPSLSTFAGGMPNVSHLNRRRSYSGAFNARGEDRWSIPFEAVTELGELYDLVSDHPEAAKRMLLPRREDDLSEQRRVWDQISIQITVLSVLDRLMYKVGTEFDEQAVLAEWKPIETWLAGESELGVDIVVPIAMAGLEVEDTEVLAPDVSLERLTDEEHLARVPEHVWGSAHPCVISAATHAIVISGYRLTEPNPLVFGPVANSFPLAKVDEAFAALRLATGLPLGYAQAYMRPKGWAWRYKAELPPVIEGITVRRYRPELDQTGWQRAPEAVDAATVAEVPDLLQAVRAAGDSLQLAVRRHSSAALRERVDDAVVDLCIALEAALGDRGQQSEMTYKLSVRAAALHAKVGSAQADVAREVKRLYNWRSKLVHGGDAQKARTAFAGDETPDSEAIRKAESIVRECLVAQLLNPGLASGQAVDAVLLSALSSH